LGLTSKLFVDVNYNICNDAGGINPWPVTISAEDIKGSVACREDTQHGATKRM
tara:strand:- start:153 stop:311 length:159 start_codon:yes stop_codon:yes gene_type:complete